ncbi:unnamed protein product, partial [Phaeothamnion confervicola]
GIGAGTKEFPKHPNILRVIIGTLTEVPAVPAAASARAQIPVAMEAPAAATAAVAADWHLERLCVLEANVDDMTGEAAAYVAARLLAAGALDTWTTPIIMKKGRPATTLHALCAPAEEARLLRLLFRDSSTLGVRRSAVERVALRRRREVVGTPF